MRKPCVTAFLGSTCASPGAEHGLLAKRGLVQVGDLARVEERIARLGHGARKAQGSAVRRDLPARDTMQYGLGDEVKRWGIAGFPGAPGWTVVRTAPFELLLQGEQPLISQLAVRLRTTAFQYNLYDSTSQFLYEADEAGRIEKSGFVGGSDPYRYWGPNGPSSPRSGIPFGSARSISHRWPTGP